MTRFQQCMVLNCDCPADQVWCCASGYQRWLVEWYVCDDHYEHLVTGDKSAPLYETRRKARRWLIMGDDLLTQTTPAGNSPSARPEPKTARPLTFRHHRLAIRRH